MYASALSLIVGVVMLVGARAGLGFIADLLSKPTQIGYMNGLALTIFVGQLPKLFGFSSDANGLIDETVVFVREWPPARPCRPRSAVGLISIAIMVVLSRWLPKIPAVLVAVVAAMAIVVALDLGAAGVELVGVLPAGLPPLTIPFVPLADIGLLRRRRPGHRRRVAGRHDLDLVRLRRAHQAGSPCQPRDGRHRRGEHRGRLLPGLPGQHERIAHGGRRTVPAHDRS